MRENSIMSQEHGITLHSPLGFFNTAGEACGEGSLADLEVQVVDENMFAYECYDIYGVLDDTVPTSICVADVIKAVQMGM